ncbi:aminoglycoside adenylyltransferase domain-containing protein [Bacillus sp. SM2101]|uniref:aminoglycoside adenylyltransferase domain-containing protein n=1 Tax=Bacillus sp. SM2101 TaxID=2805366 RepID=UPI001BDF62DC|nr:aminoglycoside adenylyltransferase domain-containing protein [Bacillus sp. SM2101]
MEPYKLLNQIIDTYQRILDNNLVGIYLHGSLAMNCYNDSSDIDFVVVVKQPIDFSTKKELIHAIIQLENVPPKGVEMSVILERFAHEIVHPTPFELHYSNFHKERYLSDNNYICGGYTDPELAAHLTIIFHRGKCLYGKEIDEVFTDVPRDIYIDAIWYDIKNAKNEIVDDAVYFTLNLCRVLYYVTEGVICSKLEGGYWGQENLPQRYRKIIGDAVKVYIGQLGEMNITDVRLLSFAEYMLHEIRKNIMPIK